MSKDQEFERIKDLQWEAYSAGLDNKSAEIAQRGAELASTAGDALLRVYFLFWYGESLRSAGDLKAAQIPLLEAARPDPEADPADQYNALTALILIALGEHEAGYCHRLIAQGRVYLAEIGKESWGHKLDFLEGVLAFRAGAFGLAESSYQRAWHGMPRPFKYPGYTPASYVDGLVETAFAKHDASALFHWQGELECCEKQIKDDKIREGAGRLLVLRAKHAEEGLGSSVPSALELLRNLQDSENSRSNNSIRVALRTLALAGHWAAVDDWLRRVQWDTVGLGDQIFHGDERLCRARHVLEMQARDDEWDQALEEICLPSLPSLELTRRQKAVTFLSEARGCYASVLTKAAAEDRRLETTWYTNTLEQRLARLSALDHALR